MTHPLSELAAAWHDGRPAGITSVCSAHSVVIEAALALACETGRPPLIEATCNQVNQDGGYTGMTPADFRRFVEEIAAKVGLDPARIILGGDHLGPNPWRHLPPDDAMEKAEAMIAAYAAAGFSKLHLDTSMGCAGEPVALPDDLTAGRAARLAKVAEAESPAPPVYVVGTEVPVPGGARGALHDIDVTAPEAARATHAAHRAAFDAADIAGAFDRVVALVVQPGVEFGHDEVVQFAPAKAAGLTAALDDLPGIVFEAHSTDYQTPESLAALVQGGFSILKVGPWLTFALREALYGLDMATDALDGHPPRFRLMEEMEAVMLAAPETWEAYYSGDAAALWRQRHFSYSDRIRYVWRDPRARAAVAALHERLAGRTVPPPVLGQFVAGAAAAEAIGLDTVLRRAVQRVLRIYDAAASA